jgi:hypothetical protein
MMHVTQRRAWLSDAGNKNEVGSDDWDNDENVLMLQMVIQAFIYIMLSRH